MQLSVLLPNDLSLEDWYAAVYGLPTVWPEASMLGAVNLRKVADVEEGENDAGENIFDDDDSGYVPTTPPKSDQGSDREPAPQPKFGLTTQKMRGETNDKSSGPQCNFSSK